MKKLIITLSLALSILTLCGCKKNDDKNQLATTHNIEITNNETQSSSLNQMINLWHITNKRICVLFGYGYNDENTVAKLTSILEERYGLDEDDGLIHTLVYPDSFKRNGRSYSSEFYSILSESEKDYAGIVILGAPESTHIALGRLQDFWSMNIPYPIIALFPQDNVLGLESTCDIVIEKAQKSDIAEEIEEESSKVEEVDPSILINTIDYVLTLNGPIPKNADLQNHAQQMLKNNNIIKYTDADTGLKSINHFVIPAN